MILRGLGIEDPREQEVSGALRLAGERLPVWFAAEIPCLIAISKDLSKKRGPALYGYEEELIPASELFEKGDAEVATASCVGGLWRSFCRREIAAEGASDRATCRVQKLFIG